MILGVDDDDNYCYYFSHLYKLAGGKSVQTFMSTFFHVAIILLCFPNYPVIVFIVTYLIQDILKTLSAVNQVSPAAQLLKARALTHLVDLELIVSDSEQEPMDMLRDALNKYLSVHEMLLKQVSDANCSDIYLQWICRT